MKRVPLVLLALLVSSPILPPASAGEISPVEWWGPTGVDAGWRMRAFVAVSNPYGVVVEDALVIAEIDLGRLLVEDGWPTTTNGGRTLPSGFELDLESLRVVEVSDFLALQAGTSHGRMIAYEPSLLGPERFEVPHKVVPGLLGSADRLEDPVGQAQPFDATSHPAVTVLWRARGETKAGGERSFLVYFDTVSSSDKPDPLSRPVEEASLESPFWSTVGRRLYGHALGGASASQVNLVGLHDDTTVEVLRSESGAFRPVPAGAAGGQNPLTLDAGQIATVKLGGTSAWVFRVDADKPVLAYVNPVGFVPALDGGYLGDRFQFAPTPEDDGIYVLSRGESPTVVAISSLGTDGQTVSSRELHLSDFQNLRPYGGSRNCDSGEAGWIELPPGPRHYRVEVREGGPVMVQLQPRAMTQVPTTEGLPVGERFLATAMWSSSPGCSARGQDVLAVSEGGLWSLRVTRLDDPIQVCPRGSQYAPQPAPQTIPRSPDHGRCGLDPANDGARDKPLSFLANGPIRVFAGGAGSQNGKNAVAGPLGGSDLGRDFFGFGEALVIAPYPNTVVTARLDHAWSGISSMTEPLGRDGLLLLRDRSFSDALLSFTLNATRPVLVYPLSADPGFLGGVPAALEADPLAAEFRGRLVSLGAADGLEPLTGSASPGESVSYAIQVENQGRALAGQDLTDTMLLKLGEIPAGWEARLDRDAVTLPAGGRDTVHLIVTAPGDAQAGDVATVSVQAQSAANPRIRDTIDAVTSVKRSFAVGIWFNIVDGPKVSNGAMDGAGLANYTVLVKNLGSTRDTLLLEPSTSEPGFTASLHDAAGAAVDAVGLDPGQVATFRLRVAAPGNTQDAVEITTVKVVSSRSPAAQDLVRAISRLQPPSDIVLEVPEAVQVVPDGQEALFPVVLRNRGDGSAEVRLDLLSDVPPGWGVPVLFAVDALGQRVPLDKVALQPGERLEAYVAQGVPGGAPATLLTSMRLSATVEGASVVREAILSLIVDARHELVVPTPDPPPRWTGPDPLRVPLEVANRGNLDEVLALAATDLAPGWRVESPEVLQVNRSDNAALTLVVVPAQGTPPGDHTLGLRLVSRDGNVTRIGLPIVVAPTLGTVSDVAGTIEARPGSSALFSVPFQNRGNRPVYVQLQAEPDEPWPLDAAPRKQVLPGWNTTVQAAWGVPRDAPDGASEHSALLVVEDAGSELAPLREEVRRRVEVARSDLRLDEAALRSGPLGSLVRVVVSNDGDRPAHDVRVVLLAADKVVAEVTIDRIATGASAPVLLAAPDVGGARSVVVDPLDAVVEADESNNAADLASQVAGDRPLVAPPAVFLILLVAIAAVSGRRR